MRLRVQDRDRSRKVEALHENLRKCRLNSAFYKLNLTLENVSRNIRTKWKRRCKSNFRLTCKGSILWRWVRQFWKLRRSSTSHRTTLSCKSWRSRLSRGVQKRIKMTKISKTRILKWTTKRFKVSEIEWILSIKASFTLVFPNKIDI